MSWGTLIGLARNGPAGAICSYDVSGYTGVRFSISGTITSGIARFVPAIPEGGQAPMAAPTSYALRREGAKLLARGSTIARRPVMTELEQASVPRLLFRTYTEKQEQQWLETTPPVMLGNPAPGATVDTNLGGVSLRFENGVLWMVPGTGRWNADTSNSEWPSGEDVSADQAVDVALDQIQKTGLLDLLPEESLDVIDAPSSLESGASGPEGGAVLVGFGVTFGRRYRCVPIFGEQLRALLSHGRLTGLMKWWEDIAGETDPSVPLFSRNELEARRNADYVKNLPLVSLDCGYAERENDSTALVSPGVGCHYRYYDPTAGGEMLAPIREEWINLSVDGTPPFP